MSETVKRILADNPDMQPGDVFVTNDPYRGGSHLPDVTVVTPVHDAARPRELLFFTASRAHHAEIGGIVPGSMPPFSQNPGRRRGADPQLQAGRSPAARARTSCAQLLLVGPLPDPHRRATTWPTSRPRSPPTTAACGSCRSWSSGYSLPVVQAYMRHIQQAAAEQDAAARWRAFPTAPTRSPIISTTARRSPSRSRSPATARRSISPAPGRSSPSNLNANRAIVTAAVLYVFRCLIDEDIPLNSGVLEPVEIVLPECLLNPPEHDDPAQCAGDRRRQRRDVAARRRRAAGRSASSPPPARGR